jgi:very-short-patch-repair endonuclease
VRGGLSDQAARQGLAKAHDRCRKAAVASFTESGLGGWKFRRQYPVGPFIVDFICLEKNVVIEVDGGQHEANGELDSQRSAYLNKMGYRVFRFWNNEVLQETEAVLTAILAILANSDQNSPSPQPLSLIGGEGESLNFRSFIK